jgi:cbb3-type cytochrome oxidase subunit 3
MILLGFVLAGTAGSNSRSAPAAAAGALISIGVLILLICAVAALWRRLRKGARNHADHPLTDDRDIVSASDQPTHSSYRGYNPSDYPAHIADGYPTHAAPPIGTGDVLPPGTP